MKINAKARQHVRELLGDYNDLKADLKELREGIMFPHSESDGNVGGGKSSLNVFEVEEKAIKLATNEQIIFRAKALKIIEDVIASSSDEAQKIIELKYFAKKPKSWISISREVGSYSEDGCRKIERKLVDRIAEKLGW